MRTSLSFLSRNSALPIAINERGVTAYGSCRGHLHRLILHVAYHERPLLNYVDARVAGRPFDHTSDTLNSFLQTRPFTALPRHTGSWTMRDQERQLRVHPGAQGSEPHPDPDSAMHPISRRRLTREHHQVDTALFERVRAMMNSLEDIEQVLILAPPEVQDNLI